MRRPRKGEADQRQHDPEREQGEIKGTEQPAEIDEYGQAAFGDDRGDGAEHRDRRETHHIAGHLQHQLDKGFDQRDDGLAFSPMAVGATPTNSEKTTIWSTLFCAIASTMDVGKTWRTKSLEIERGGVDAGILAFRDQIEARARLQHIGVDHADRQRDERRDDEPEDGPPTDPAKRRGVVHAGRCPRRASRRPTAR